MSSRKVPGWGLATAFRPTDHNSCVPVFPNGRGQAIMATGPQGSHHHQPRK
jgi:hypothetical protein